MENLVLSEITNSLKINVQKEGQRLLSPVKLYCLFHEIEYKIIIKANVPNYLKEHSILI